MNMSSLSIYTPPMQALTIHLLLHKPCFIIIMDLFKVLILLLLSSLMKSALGAVLHYTWEVSYMHWSPDGEERVVMAINGQFPGPTISARVGDTVQVNLTNHLYTEGVVIHWHGIRQMGTPWADGTASISQCAINPGETFFYRFQVDKAGTYFYHGHYGMQRAAGLYGSLIVDLPENQTEPFHYDAEFNLLLSDWWHKSSHEQEVDLSSVPSRWIGEPQTLLINGRGQYNCSLAARYSNGTANECHIRGGEQYAPYILHAEPNRTYRLRIASTTSLAALNLAIGHHRLTVVEADGNYVQPFTVENMDIYSGESYSVLFTTNQAPSNTYWVSASVRGREPGTPPGLTTLSYHPSTASMIPISPPPVAPEWNDYNYSKRFTNQIYATMDSPKPPAIHHRRIVLLNTQNLINGQTKWAINNVSLSLPPTPYLGAIRYGLNHSFDHRSPPDNFSPDYDVMSPAVNQNTVTGNGVYMLNYNTVIDVILQNANALRANVSEIHPWHMHGHDFWVLGYGEGRFTDANATSFNLTSPPLRNTAVIFPYGWTALRFVADNPGVWAFHCHIEPHLHMGMGVVLAEGVRRLSNIPNETIGCGFTRRLFMNDGHN